MHFGPAGARLPRENHRALASRAGVLETLRTGSATPAYELEVVKADLTSDRNWDAALRGCAYVLHVASPVSFATPAAGSAHLKPAVEGALRVLSR